MSSLDFGRPKKVTAWNFVLASEELRVCSLDQKFSRVDFPDDFVFGSGTSAYQVEGAAFEDGKKPSIWDNFSHSGPGANGDIACDGYHKYKEDVQLMIDTGLEAYRFSISWSRLIPNGRGPINAKGLQYYNNVIDELTGHGIQPHVTLTHFDLPQVLEDEYEGWLSRKAVRDFTAYADVCFREFGDRVFHWTTFNEANMVAMAGYDMGMMPPGRCSTSLLGINCTKGNSSYEPYLAAHNMLLAHASAARLYKKKYKVIYAVFCKDGLIMQAAQRGSIGINVFAYWFVPYSKSPEDVIATQRANEFYVGWLVNPLVFGDYPGIVKKNAGTRIPAFTKAESKYLKGSIDFLGVNHYATTYIKDRSSSLNLEDRDVMADMAVQISYGGNQDERSPYEGLGELLDYLKHVYNDPPIYIHENGKATPSTSSLIDTSRVEVMQGFIGSMLDALRNGANVKGYFSWSFLDVFEIVRGSKFGMYYVDFDDKDLRRYPKLSAYWYSSFLKGRNMNKYNVVEVQDIQLTPNNLTSGYIGPKII
ncbi:beta-glucosidase 11-like [Apium graveolens]|uniref:beta-glucosidase 11-like n=1 Tax=Apium graveolens TaxID=4045 RepID=UPI003D7BE760